MNLVSYAILFVTEPKLFQWSWLASDRFNEQVQQPQREIPLSLRVSERRVVRKEEASQIKRPILEKSWIHGTGSSKKIQNSLKRDKGISGRDQ